jgi:hypothetical protein
VTCAKLHRIPHMWIAPGVPQAFLTKPQKMGQQREYFGEPMEGVITSFFLRKKRWGALANTKSPALKFRSNGVVDFIYVFCFLCVGCCC